MEDFDIRKYKTLDECTEERLERIKEAIKTQTLHKNCVTLSRGDVEWMVSELETKKKEKEKSVFAMIGISKEDLQDLHKRCVELSNVLIIDSLDREKLKKEIFLKFEKIEMPVIPDPETDTHHRSAFFGGNGKRIKKNNFFKGKKVK